MWTGSMAVGNAGLILYLDTKLPDPFYANFFIMLLTAIDGKKKQRGQTYTACCSNPPLIYNFYKFN